MLNCYCNYIFVHITADWFIAHKTVIGPIQFLLLITIKKIIALAFEHFVSLLIFYLFVFQNKLMIY